MRLLVLATFAALALPGIARAGQTTLVVRDLPVGARALAESPVQASFDMVGLHWRGPGKVFYRARRLSGGWTPWQRGDDDTTAPQHGWHIGNPDWVGLSDRLEYRAARTIRRLRAYYVDSPVERSALRTVSMTGSPAIVPRAGWQALEQIRRAKPRYAPLIKLAVVHHTVNTNGYGPEESAAIVRGIEVYHVKGNGWDDIGYNFLVDRYGQVFEGRYGGMDRNVVGAHSQGFNRGTVGVALIGNYSSTSITPEQRAALVKLLAWRLDVAHVDPLSFANYFSGGNSKFPAGKPVLLRAISGHRDTYFTECPGNAAYAQLPSIAKQVAQTGLPKLYEPLVNGTLGGRIRFTGTLTSALPWTVMVSDAAGKKVASGRGVGPAVDWTWNSAGAVGIYSWTMEGGPSVRPATGSIGGVLPPATLISGLTANPLVVTPNADGTGDSSTFNFTLGADSTVTAVVLDAGGAPLVTLFSEPRVAGRSSFEWDASTLPDGHYRVVVTATAAGRSQSLSLPMIVDRTLAGFAATPATFSPNGDGVFDTTTFSFALAAAVPVALDIRQNGATLASIFSGTLQPGPQTFDWNGKNLGTVLADGAYEAVATVTDGLGVVSLSIPLTIDTRPPTLTLLDPQQLKFLVDEPATVTLLVNNRRIVKVEPAGVFTVPHQGSVVSVSAVAEDAAGNVSAPAKSP